MKELFLVSFRKYAVLTVFTGCFLWTQSSFSQSGVVTTTPPKNSIPTEPGAGLGITANQSPEAATATASLAVVLLAPVSDDALYRMFFRFEETVDDLADKLEKEG